MDNKALPRAVYRLQLNPDFTFVDARNIVPYLHTLGISHLYLSPCLTPRTGSSHGYDIVDHGRLNPELGGGEAFSDLVDTLHARDMGLLLDFAPNHMGIGYGENAWWMDVLENGQASSYASYFDIDWHPIRESLRGKVLLPVLDDHYGKVLEAGKLELEFDQKRGEFSVRFLEQRLPLDPETYPAILAHEMERFAALVSQENHTLIEWHSLISDFERLRQLRTVPIERSHSAAACKQQFASLYQQSPNIRVHLSKLLTIFNGKPGQAKSFDNLHRLLELQAFRLTYWRVASDEINYRRFFDINHLVCLRQQNPEVFEASHRLILALVADGSIDGIRIDHIDGLWNPRSYCQCLQEEFSRITNQTPDRGDTFPKQVLYLLVEKILAEYEHLRDDWPIAGTTGYEFANLVNGLFVHIPSERELSHIYAHFIGQQLTFDEVLYDCKRQVIRNQMSSHLTMLVNLLGTIAESERTTRDYTLNGLREALTEVVVCFPVYRTYIMADDIADEDRRFVEWAINQAKKRSPTADITIFDFIRDVLLLQNLEGRSAEYDVQLKLFVMKFQQYTAPVMAKSMEDTSFYVYNRLLSLNDVGGDPRHFGTSVAAFHHANQQRLRQWPASLITLTTHDSKRSGDVRARINVLSELAQDWQQAASRWRRLNRSKKRRVDGQLAPSHNAEYLLYQTLLGAWPVEHRDSKSIQSFTTRIEAYMLKAAREAKIHTSWINPNLDYEQVVSGFVQAVLNPKKSSTFHDDFLALEYRVTRIGFYNSLSQTLLLLTSPGVPDLYQGTELWRYTLVDPDNRRTVDFDIRQQHLNSLQNTDEASDRVHLLENLLKHIDDGRVKLFVIWKTLAFRKTCPELFWRGDYLPLKAIGEKAEHICAFQRRDGNSFILAITGRWFARLEQNPDTHAFMWQDTRIELPHSLKDAAFRDIFSETIIRLSMLDDVPYLPISEVFRHLPIALLTLQAAGND